MKEHKEKKAAKAAERRKKAPLEVPRNSRNHFEVFRGSRFFMLLKHNHGIMKTYKKHIIITDVAWSNWIKQRVARSDAFSDRRGPHRT